MFELLLKIKALFDHFLEKIAFNKVNFIIFISVINLIGLLLIHLYTHNLLINCQYHLFRYGYI